MNTRFKSVLLVLFLISVVALACVPATGDTGSPESEATGIIRFVHTLSGPPLKLAFDGQPFTDLPWNEESFRARWIHPYFQYPVGAYELSANTLGEDGEQIASMPIDIEADHRYTLILHKTPAAEHELLWIDETAALAGHDPEEEALYILANIIDGTQPLRVVIEGETTLEDVAYGTHKLGIDPKSPVDGVDVYTGDELLFEWPDVETYYPGAYFLQTYDGNFPGEPFQDYFPVAIATFVGELTFQEGDLVTLNAELNGRIPGTGVRIRHPLTLSEKTTLTFSLDRTEPWRGAYKTEDDLDLRVYEEDGSLLLQANDGTFSGPIQFTDVDLPAGNYIVEVGKFYDVGTGEYILQVSEE